MSLNEVEIGNEVVISDVVTDDDEMRGFLFSLGCYQGANITVVSRKKSNVVVSIKDARYNIDSDLAEAICV